MKKVFKFLSFINLKTIRFNFKYLPFKHAIKFPILISGKTYLRGLEGKVVIKGALSTGMIKIGYGNVGIFDIKVSRTIWEVSGTVIFKGKAFIGHGSKISVAKGGNLILGENFKITAESSLVASTHVEFGKDCLLSWDILVMDTDFHKIRDNTGLVINNPSPIVIGNKVWIASRSLILKGTNIPDNSIIGAASVVGKVLDNAGALYAGIPAKMIREGVSWEA